MRCMRWVLPARVVAINGVILGLQLSDLGDVVASKRLTESFNGVPRQGPIGAATNFAACIGRTPCFEDSMDASLIYIQKFVNTNMFNHLHMIIVAKILHR